MKNYKSCYKKILRILERWQPSFNNPEELQTKAEVYDIAIRSSWWRGFHLKEFGRIAGDQARELELLCICSIIKNNKKIDLSLITQKVLKKTISDESQEDLWDQIVTYIQIGFTHLVFKRRMLPEEFEK